MTPTSIYAPTRGTTGAFANTRWLDATTWVNEYFLQDQFYVFGDKLALLAGARIDVLDRRLTLTAGVYDLANTNILAPPAPPSRRGWSTSALTCFPRSRTSPV